MALSRLLDTTAPRLLTVAACGGLEPAPDSRLRGTYPHLWHSIAPPFVSAFVAHGRLLKPRPGRPQRTDSAETVVASDPVSRLASVLSRSASCAVSLPSATSRVMSRTILMA